MKRSIILLLAAVMAFTGLTAVSCSSGSPKDIKVMTFNIRLSPREDFDGDNCWNNRREAVIRMLEESKPDLFGIQEGYITQVNYMEENQLQIWKGRIKILYSSLKDSDAAILGASALAW